MEGGCVRHGGQHGRREGSAVKERHLAPSPHGGERDSSDSHTYHTQLKNNNNGIYFSKKKVIEENSPMEVLSEPRQHRRMEVGVRSSV